MGVSAGLADPAELRAPLAGGSHHHCSLGFAEWIEQDNLKWWDL